MSESYQEKLNRVRMMSDPDIAPWDLSEEDCEALAAVIARLDELEGREKSRLQTISRILYGATE